MGDAINDAKLALRGRHGESLMHWAVYCKNVDLVKALVAKGRMEIILEVAATKELTDPFKTKFVTDLYSADNDMQQLTKKWSELGRNRKSNVPVGVGH